MTKLDAISGAGGMIIIDDTNAHSGLNYSYLIPREDTVISALTGVNASGDVVNLLTTQNWDGTLQNTDFLIVPRDWVITEITLTSGSIQCF
jgi:hypothetical protein